MQLAIDADELCGSIKINKQTLIKHRNNIRICPRLIGMPEPYVTRPRMLWWVADIEAWAESRRTFKPVPTPEIPVVAIAVADIPAPSKRKVGRPTNAEKYGEAK